MTRGAIPPGADGVIMVELTATSNDGLTVAVSQEG